MAVPKNVELPSAFYDWFIVAPNAVRLIGTALLVAGFVTAAHRGRTDH